MKTKLLALLLVLVMIVSVLVACEDKPDGPKCDGVNHIDENKDNKCDYCGKTIRGNTDKPNPDDPVAELPEITWDETTLLFQMTHNSNNEELSSGCMKYLAGESDDVGSIYQNVKDRNREAEDYAGVDVEYLYYADTADYQWGRSITRICEAAKLTSEKGRPDIFCNFVYDMVSASLQGAFNNLYTDKLTSNGVASGELANYFQFAKDGKYDATYKDTGEGYMVEYMQSMTLSEQKMYLVASDYFIDLVRAFFIVPVNIELLRQIEPSNHKGDYNYDYTGDGTYDIDDFYELVNDQRWNYDAVKGFSGQIKSKSAATGSGDVLDGVHGFALAEGGLGASGLLYTTSIVVIQREVATYTDPDTGLPYQDYTFWYPESSEPLEEFCENLESLFRTEGVTSVSTSSYGSSPEQAVRNRFATNYVLFGGIICVGSLEEQEYKDMTAEGKAGFGVAPVPLYRAGVYDEDAGEVVPDRYLTQIHNVGRVGGIAVRTNKFAQCTAFLNYQSLNSTDILNDYYDWTLKSDVAGDVEGNADMLDYIRSNVRSAFDKTFEDAIGRFYLEQDATYNQKKWHNMILHANFLLTRAQMHSEYDSVRAMKAAALESMEISYTGLP